MKIRPDLAYVAQCETDGWPVKVGHTSNVKRRIDSFRGQNPHPIRLVAIIMGGKKTEAELKELLSEDRISGEWFRPTIGLKKYLEDKLTSGDILESCEVTNAFCEAQIIPKLEENMKTKELHNLKHNPGGDFVYRLLSGGITNPAARIKELCNITLGDKQSVSIELLYGYIASTSLTSDLRFPNLDFVIDDKAQDAPLQG